MNIVKLRSIFRKQLNLHTHCSHKHILDRVNHITKDYIYEEFKDIVRKVKIKKLSLCLKLKYSNQMV